MREDGPRAPGAKKAFARDALDPSAPFFLAAAFRAPVAAAGLGRAIFDARELIHSQKMLASILALRALPIALERLVFQRIEARAVARWSAVTAAR
jgi:ABC-type nitrate/sulfonate/bicarbonate transport system permease component